MKLSPFREDLPLIDVMGSTFWRALRMDEQLLADG